MTLSPDIVWCPGCGVEITWAPYIKNNQQYCCEECARGIPCHCGDRIELDDEHQRSSSSPA